MREFSGAASLILAFAIVCTLVTIDRVVMARTPDNQAKQAGARGPACGDVGQYLTRIYQRRGIVFEKPNPGRAAETKRGIPVTGHPQQNCQAPIRRPGETM